MPRVWLTVALHLVLVGLLFPRMVLAQMIGTCKADVEVVSVTTEGNTIHVDFTAVDKSFDENGEMYRRVFIRFEGTVSGRFTAGELRSASSNFSIYSSTHVVILPGDRSESGTANISGVFDELGEIKIFGRVQQCSTEGG